MVTLVLKIRVTNMRTEIIIRATRTQNVLGEKGRRTRELTSLVQKRFKFLEKSVEHLNSMLSESITEGSVLLLNLSLCVTSFLEALLFARACNGVLMFVMESGAIGCEVIISRKLRVQRAKSMKFKDGYMLSSRQPVKEYTDSAVRHVLLRQGVLGIKEVDEYVPLIAEEPLHMATPVPV
nr:40S ribosomal protein S3-1-like [Tanacetum cinerariifolium]